MAEIGAAIGARETEAFMDSNRIRSIPAVLLAVLALGNAGCGARPAAAPELLTDAERAEIADTLRQISREASQTFDSDLDCEEIVDRLASPRDPGYFVAQGRLIEPGNREDAVRLCRMIKQDRLSAHEDVQEQRVEVMSRDAAVVVTRGVYTVRYRDSRTIVRPQVVTSVWARNADGWRRVHLHESWQVGGER
jgi:hypothetical protein